MGRSVLVVLATATWAIAALGPLDAQTAQGERPAGVEGALAIALFDLGNSLGMLRDIEHEDSITTQEVFAEGTMNADGQAFKVTNYRLSLNYSVPGMRVDITRAGPGGEQRTIEVVSGDAAWNETEPGLNPSPAPGTARARLVQLWTTPIGVVKAATAAGDAATVASEGGDTVLTFPLPAPVDDVMMTATLRRDNDLFVYWASEPAAQARIKNRILPLYRPMEGLVGTYLVRVAAELGGVVTETVYSEYGDWNVDDNKADIMWPRRISQQQGGVTTLDLRVTLTNTYNPYVVMRVPDNIRDAGGQ